MPAELARSRTLASWESFKYDGYTRVAYSKSCPRSGGSRGSAFKATTRAPIPNSAPSKMSPTKLVCNRIFAFVGRQPSNQARMPRTYSDKSYPKVGLSLSTGNVEEARFESYPSAISTRTKIAMLTDVLSKLRINQVLRFICPRGTPPDGGLRGGCGACLDAPRLP